MAKVSGKVAFTQLLKKKNELGNAEMGQKPLFLSSIFPQCQMEQSTNTDDSKCENDSSSFKESFSLQF